MNTHNRPSESTPTLRLEFEALVVLGGELGVNAEILKDEQRRLKTGDWRPETEDGLTKDEKDVN